MSGRYFENSLNWKERLDGTKWFLTLMIVLYHIYYPNVEMGGDEYNLFMYIKNIADCTVPAFSLISGYLFFRNIETMNDVKSKICRRMRTLVIPYILWNFLHSLCLVVCNNGLQSLFDYDWIRGVLLWDSSPHFWYIFMLIFWTIFSPVLYIIFKKKNILCIFTVAQIAYFIYVGENILTSRFCYIVYTWGAVAGIYVPNIIESICSFFDGYKWKALLFSVMGMLYFGIYVVYADVQNNFIRVFFYFFRALIVLIVSLNIPQIGIKYRRNIHKYSFWVFAVHYYLDNIVSNVLYELKVPILVYQLGSWMCVVVIGVVSGALLQKWIPSVYGVLIGERNKEKYRVEV